MANPSLVKPRTGVVVIDSRAERSRSIVDALVASGYDCSSFESIEHWLGSGRLTQSCVVVDWQLAEHADLPGELARRGKDLPILYVSEQANTSEIACAIRGGAFDFLRWPEDQASLGHRVERALEANLSRLELRAQLDSVLGRMQTLTRRQREVMHLVAIGCPNKIVSAELGISERTVEVHRAEAMRRIGADSMAQLVVLDLAANWFEGGSPWSADQWMRGLQTLVGVLQPQQDSLLEQRVA